MAFDGPFSQVGSGFAGQPSDGLAQLDASHALTSTFDAASNGNVVQVAQISAGHRHRTRDAFTLALGFGAMQAGAVGHAEASLGRSFDRTLRTMLVAGSAMTTGCAVRRGSSPA